MGSFSTLMIFGLSSVGFFMSISALLMMPGSYAPRPLREVLVNELNRDDPKVVKVLHRTHAVASMHHPERTAHMQLDGPGNVSRVAGALKLINLLHTQPKASWPGLSVVPTPWPASPGGGPGGAVAEGAGARQPPDGAHCAGPRDGAAAPAPRRLHPGRVAAGGGRRRRPSRRGPPPAHLQGVLPCDHAGFSCMTASLSFVFVGHAGIMRL